MAGPAVRIFGEHAEAYRPPPKPGSFLSQLDGRTADCRAQRVQLAGAALNNVLVHPTAEVFEQMWRRLPEAGFHNPDVSPEHPFTIPLGGFRVPREMGLLVFDFRPDIYRFVGVDAFDTVPFEERRFARQIGFEIKIDGRRPWNTKFELEPGPRSAASDVYVDPNAAPGQLAPPQVFAQARANQFAAAAGSGLATLPQRTQRVGAPDLPLSLYLRESQTLEANVICFRRVMTAVAFVEFDFAGILMPRITIEKLLECLNPV